MKSLICKILVTLLKDDEAASGTDYDRVFDPFVR